MLDKLSGVWKGSQLVERRNASDAVNQAQVSNHGCVLCCLFPLFSLHVLWCPLCSCTASVEFTCSLLLTPVLSCSLLFSLCSLLFSLCSLGWLSGNCSKLQLQHAAPTSEHACLSPFSFSPLRLRVDLVVLLLLFFFFLFFASSPLCEAVGQHCLVSVVCCLLLLVCLKQLVLCSVSHLFSKQTNPKKQTNQQTQNSAVPKRKVQHMPFSSSSFPSTLSRSLFAVTRPEMSSTAKNVTFEEHAVDPEEGTANGADPVLSKRPLIFASYHRVAAPFKGLFSVCWEWASG